ncbi:hypothetical protein X777_00614 [Ooceraea biroi]|uniref:Uncharacterized protein n=1 Tax=Ooceraea biroi TaxID=2015173 RepID=A0A026X2L0_OOCBI|nr:hypothetical protein X777_00614 [Ooceraea biroi]
MREKQRERDREKDGMMVIDYANDQTGGWCSDSSPAADAIAVWQFAAVRVHLTRFKTAAIIDGANEKERKKIEDPGWEIDQ